MPQIRFRWVAIGIFVFSSMLNYLDRQLLAAVAPAVRAEFHLSNGQYGQLVSVFSIVYALMAPLAGLFIDHVGLNAGVSIAVLIWSAAGVTTGLTNSFRGLLASRTVLGMAQAAGIPCFGKANATYLEPRELALGQAVNQVAISLALTLAPLIAAAMTAYYSWRFAFVVCGALGMIWVPIWLIASKRIPAPPAAEIATHTSIGKLLRDRRLWGLVVATVFIMSVYTLWTNWTTLYFVEQWHLTQQEANARFAWIPQLFTMLGGFFGAWLAFYWIRGGLDVLKARMRVCWISAAMTLATAAIPFMPTPALATTAICISAFWGLGITTNLYSLPIDLFGPARAAFGIAVLTFAYGLMQTFVSPAIGSIVDHFGFTTVCFSVAALPLVGVGILRIAIQ